MKIHDVATGAELYVAVMGTTIWGVRIDTPSGTFTLMRESQAVLIRHALDNFDVTFGYLDRGGLSRYILLTLDDFKRVAVTTRHGVSVLKGRAE